MEKFNKHPYFPLRTSATTFDQQPLVGVGSVYPPNILLALSVEYPTAGAAYEAANIWNPKGKRQLNEQKFDQSKSFIGYFDSGKCYSYIGSGDNAYFTPVNTTSNGNCGGNTFSGKALNWLGMSAIDIFRKEMTGGNRAFGAKGSSVGNYQNGDRPNRTTLRRAFVICHTAKPHHAVFRAYHKVIFRPSGRHHCHELRFQNNVLQCADQNP